MDRTVGCVRLSITHNTRLPYLPWYVDSLVCTVLWAGKWWPTNKLGQPQGQRWRSLQLGVDKTWQVILPDTFQVSSSLAGLKSQGNRTWYATPGQAQWLLSFCIHDQFFTSSPPLLSMEASDMWLYFEHNGRCQFPWWYLRQLLCATSPSIP